MKRRLRGSRDEERENEELTRGDGQEERGHVRAVREDVEEERNTERMMRGNGEEDPSKDDIFRMIRAELNESKTFEDILTIANGYRTTLIRHSVKVGCAPSRFTKDEAAAHWLPTDAPCVTPMQIYGDGNCLPRCASVMVYGHQECHDEMRIRIVLEMAVEIDEYLDSTSLKGESELDEDLPKIYAMYSEHYNGQKLSEQAVRSILEAEVEQCAKPTSYMGIWQLHALSNILNCKLMSIYPQHGGATVRRHLHRWITPFPKPSPFQWSQIAIMWTSTQGKEQEAKDWRVNHFVVCVPHMA